MSETRSEQGRSNNRADTRASILGFVFLAAILYFAVVFWQLPDDEQWWITLGVAVAVGVLAFVAYYWPKLLGPLRRFGFKAYDFLSFLLVVVVIVVVPISLDRPERIVLLKAAAIVYFSLLPALLYLQFTSRKTLAVWNDFVANLYKLDADDIGNLPRPSPFSPYYEKWTAVRDRAWGKGWVHMEPGEKKRKQADKRLDQANPYEIKFRELFGRIPDPAEPTNAFSVQTTHKLQVVMATALIAVGWAFVLQPDGVFGLEIPADVELTNLPNPKPPTDAFAFGFLGAYFYILQMLVRRYFQNDLKSTAYINATMRLVIVILLVWAVIPLLDDYTDVSQPTLFAIAFVIGVFPSVGWQFLQQTLIRKPIGLVVDSLEPKHKLGDLDGLNIWYESRLLEVGVEDMQNLTTTDIVDLMLNTRIPVDRIVDWIDQAFLYVRVTDEHRRALLRSYGIRTATDLDDALTDPAHAQKIERLLNYVLDKDGVVVVVGGKVIDDGLPSRILVLHATTETERNLRHVRAWKRYTVAEPRREPVRKRASKEEPASATAPATT